MSINMKLSGSVGKMGANKTMDVMAVQPCLSNIKVKMKPLFKGRVDGKAGQDLIDAICVFQANEKIKPSGKMMPDDQTVSKLKMRTPSSVKPTALPMGGAAKPGNTSKAKELARRAADQIKRVSSLPVDDAASLAKAVMAAGEDGIPVSLSKVEVTTDSKFQVTLEIAKATLPSSDPSFIKSLAEKVSVYIAKSTRWSSGHAGTLTYKTMRAYDGLQSKAKPSRAMVQTLDIDTSGFTEAANAILGSLEKLSNARFDK